MTKKIKKLLLTSAICGLYLSTSSTTLAAGVESSSQAVVSDLQVKLTGYADFQVGLRNQSHLSGSEKNVSAHGRDFAFFNQTALFLDISNTVDALTYGGKIVLAPTALKGGGASYNGSNIYIESDFGRVEAGSPISANSIMSIDAETIASASGDWPRFANFESAYLKNGTTLDPTFAAFIEYFLDSKLVTDIDERKYSNEPARRVSYYTPKFEFGQGTKVQAGFSYTPDSSNTGADTPDKISSGFSKHQITAGQYFKFDKSVKNAVSVGVVLEQNISDGIDLKVAATGEVGKSAGKAQLFNTTDTEEQNPLASYKLKDLRTYNIGSVLNVGNFSYAASYGSLGKSLTTSAYQKTGQNTSYYTGGIAYNQGPFGASVTYFRSDQFKNRVDCVTLGTDYKLAPGFKPYAEISGFTLKGKPDFYPNLKKKSTRGTVAIVGAKLSL